MPVPTSFNDLDTVAANNSPPGTESAKGNVDNYLRQGFSFSKQLYNAISSGSYTWLGTAAGTVDVITASATPAIAAYAAGQVFRFLSAGTNTTNVTININGLGAKAITKYGSTALVASDIPSGAVCEIVYDGTRFQLINVNIFGTLPISKGGTGATTAGAARSALGIATVAKVTGLQGGCNSATPLTKFDLSAVAVVLQDANGAAVANQNTGTITCDLGAAGSAANGRDQSGAFTANSWVYLYFIWNGTTLASLASATAPTSFTGSTLPTGYTHWAFATVIRWNASSNIVKCFVRGAKVFYDVDTSNAVLNAGSATSFTTLSLATWIPPNCLSVGLMGLLAVNHNVAGAGFTAALRATGSSISAGVRAAQLNVLLTTSTNYMVFDKEVAPGTSSSIDYKLSAAPSTSGGVYVDVSFYSVPNGDC